MSRIFHIHNVAGIIAACKALFCSSGDGKGFLHDCEPTGICLLSSNFMAFCITPSYRNTSSSFSFDHLNYDNLDIV